MFQHKYAIIVTEKKSSGESRLNVIELADGLKEPLVESDEELKIFTPTRTRFGARRVYSRYATVFGKLPECIQPFYLSGKA